MSLVTTIPAAVLETILARLATLFLTGAGGDLDAARHAAVRMLGAYHAETEDELCLAANIISFSFQALEALAQAAAPDLSLTRILRLRGGAVSLSRQAEKARRSLNQLQKTRRENIQAQSVETKPEPTQPTPKIEPAKTPIQDQNPIAVAAEPTPKPWNDAEEHRQREIRIAAGLKRLEARAAERANAERASTGVLAAMPNHRNATMAQAM
jgi:hypothetical protein